MGGGEGGDEEGGGVQSASLCAATLGIAAEVPAALEDAPLH